MYGLVLLTATMTTPGNGPVPAIVSPQVGCWGSCYGSCYGSCSGCYGACFGSCYGSCRGVSVGCHGGLFGFHKSSCHGCTSYNCNGWNCFGSCFGSCHGLHKSCHGCYGSCFGSCFGSGVSCYGSCYGSVWNSGVVAPAVVAPGVSYGPAYYPNYSDPWAVYGTVNGRPAVIIPVASDAKPADKPMDKPVAPPPSDKDKKDGMGATLKFQLPADAKLYVDGRQTVLTGTERLFTTPPLSEGQKFYYDVRAELMVDGKAVVEEKRVVIEAGSNLTESFAVLFAAAKRKGDAVAGRE